MTKKLTQKNVKREITKAIKKVATAGLKEIKNPIIKEMRAYTYKPKGLWWDKIKIETTIGTPVYNPGLDLYRWCVKTGFPMPKNEEEKNKIEKLADYRFYILKRELKNFINDILDILVAERAILFYLGVAIGIILGFCGYHYYF